MTDHTFSDLALQTLANEYKRKHSLYKLLQLLTLGIVKKFPKAKEHYLRKYEALIHKDQIRYNEELLSPIEQHFCDEFRLNRNTFKQAITTIFDPNKIRIFVDVSELRKTKRMAGIPRVVVNYLYWLFELLPANYEIYPVYLEMDYGKFLYSHNFMPQMFPKWAKNQALLNRPIDYFAGDVFVGLGLGLNLDVNIIKCENIFQDMQSTGVSVWFILYDLLPIYMPQYFEKWLVDDYPKLLKTISDYNSISISKTVANELREWRKNYDGKKNVRVEPLHLGADITKIQDIFPNAVIEAMQPYFLMVGTIEPRKGHALVLDAFAKLWRDNFPFNLVIIGRKGWHVKALAQKIKKHQYFNKKLYWLDNADDQLLTAAYKSATGLIFASEGEGFGLPLIEAAQHKVPIIARDIPIFREVAEDNAFYFASDEATGLVQEILEWIKLQKQGTEPKSDNMSWLTWEQSACKLIEILLAQKEGK